MSDKEKIDLKRLPKHIAIIMDGNGRWAKRRGNQRIYGHRNAVKAVRDTVEGATELGIEYITLYAFSTENWKRPKGEIDALMTLLVSTVHKETKTLIDNNVKLLTIGDLDALPRDVNAQLNKAVEITKNNTGLTLVLALSYSSRWEIIEAVKKITEQVKAGKLEPSEIDNYLFEKFLNTADFPEPDLLIRTSGEYQLSNFLLWQIAYTELYFTTTLWPDFRREHLYKAILDFQNRERRFGKISEQMSHSININS